MILGRPPQGWPFLFKIAFHFGLAYRFISIRVWDLAVIHTFASMAGRAQGQALAAQLRK